MAEMKENGKSGENVWLNLGFNILAPTLLLIKGKAIFSWFGVDLAGSSFATSAIFVSALLFPLAYGIYDLLARRKWNVFSIIGILSVLLTGGIGLMKLSREWMIVKETAVPLILGVVVLATLKTKKPLVKLLVMNESVLDLERIESALDQRGTREDFGAYLRKATYLVAASFLVSAALNCALACMIFKSPAGTDAFNEEVGRMTALSWPVIVLPTTLIMIFAIMQIFKAIKNCAGLDIEEALASHLRDKGSEKK